MSSISSMHQNAAFHRLPEYFKKYEGKTIVLKYGGELADNESFVENVGKQVAFLRKHLHANVIVVHGAGSQVTQACEAEGIEKNVDSKGKRITDTRVMKIFERVVSEINRKNVEIMQGSSDKVSFLPMSGKDLGSVFAQAASPENLVAKNIQINQQAFANLGENAVPVFYSVCKDMNPNNPTGMLNANADDFASAIATSLRAERLIFLSNVPGILNKNGERLTDLSPKDIDALKDKGIITDGMIAKAEAAQKAAISLSSNGGVVILGGLVDGVVQEDSIFNELFLPEGSGTLIRSQERVQQASTLG